MPMHMGPRYTIIYTLAGLFPPVIPTGDNRCPGARTMPRHRIGPSRRCKAFTLVEILIVVIIIGVLGAAVVAQFADVMTDTRKTAFIADMRTFAEAAYLYMAETSMYLEDSSSGVFPTGWDDYASRVKWEGGTPVGGVWDVEQDGFAGMEAGLGVHFNDGSHPGDAYMQDIDASIDDGNLSTGGFRKIADDRYYFVLITE